MRREVLVLLLLLPVIGFILDRRHLLDPVRSTVTAILGPVSGSLSHVAITVHDTVVVIPNIRFLAQDNERLQQENRQLQASLADKQDLVHENDLLRTELALTKRETTLAGAAAFIVGRSNSNTFGTYLINRGSRDGIHTGQVVVSGGTLVGQVTDVYESTSHVLPITNVNSAIPVVLAQSRGVGLLRGGVKGLTVQEISRDVSIVPGEAVVTSTLGGVLPPGILVGIIEQPSGQGADVFQTASVTSPVPFNWLELVTILRGA